MFHVIRYSNTDHHQQPPIYFSWLGVQKAQSSTDSFSDSLFIVNTIYNLFSYIGNIYGIWTMWRFSTRAKVLISSATTMNMLSFSTFGGSENVRNLLPNMRIFLFVFHLGNYWKWISPVKGKKMPKMLDSYGWNYFAIFKFIWCWRNFFIFLMLS